MPSFGYHNILKTEWLKGKLPTVKRGFYGDILTKETVSLEHLDCVCNGGETVTSNLVLASKKQNNLYNRKDLHRYAAVFASPAPRCKKEYLRQVSSKAYRFREALSKHRVFQKVSFRDVHKQRAGNGRP